MRGEVGQRLIKINFLVVAVAVDLAGGLLWLLYLKVLQVALLVLNIVCVLLVVSQLVVVRLAAEPKAKAKVFLINGIGFFVYCCC